MWGRSLFHASPRPIPVPWPVPETGASLCFSFSKDNICHPGRRHSAGKLTFFLLWREASSLLATLTLLRMACKYIVSIGNEGIPSVMRERGMGRERERGREGARERERERERVREREGEREGERVC